VRSSSPGREGAPPPRLDTGVAHSARVWNYLLGGKDNFVTDRGVGDMILQMFPDIAHIARVQRRFLARAIRYLAGETGIWQFLDIGTGLPTADNTHQIAQQIAPQSRIVYVDSDPLVLVHARALLTSAPGGVTSYVEADVRDTEEILKSAAQTLDFSQPVAVMLLIVLHLIPDADDPHGIVTRLVDSLPPGSHLVLSHPANDVRPVAMAEMARRVNARLGPARGTMRDRAAITRFFDGLVLAEPGVVQPQQWRPADPASTTEVTAWCGVAGKL